MRNDDLDRVVPLDQLDDYQVADGDPDIRGWDVMSAEGQKIGEVDELLVDTAAMKVRYLDVDLEDELMSAADGGERHVLIPIGYARLDRDADCVRVDALRAADLSGLPAYDHGPLTREFETSVRDSFSSRMAPSADDHPARRDALSAGDPARERETALGMSSDERAVAGTIGGAGTRPGMSASPPSTGFGAASTSGTSGGTGGGFLRDETTSVGDRGRTGTTGGVIGGGLGARGTATPDTTGAGFAGGRTGDDPGSDRLSDASREGLTDRLASDADRPPSDADRLGSGAERLASDAGRNEEAGPGHTRGGERNADDFYAGRAFDDTSFWASRRGRMGED